ncbi:MAG: hypothetical protein V7724_18400 [Sediminicola sp.]
MEQVQEIREPLPPTTKKQLKRLVQDHFNTAETEIDLGFRNSLERMHLIGHLLEVSIATLEHKYHIKNDGSASLNVVTTLELANQLLPTHESEFMDELRSILQEQI